MSFWNNPENNTAKALLIIVLLVAVGFGIFKLAGSSDSKLLGSAFAGTTGAQKSKIGGIGGGSTTKLFIFGGINGEETDQRLNTTYTSLNGSDWTLTSEDGVNPWARRAWAETQSLGGKIYIFAGRTNEPPGTAFLNDVWSSVDGVNWTPILEHAPWGKRVDAESTIHLNQIYIMGGSAGALYNDLWKTSNGIDWTLVNDSLPWGGRTEFGFASYGHKLWFVGGINHNDVWSSLDGVAWTNVIENGEAPFNLVSQNVLVSFKNKLFMIGGSNTAGEVWSTTDGADWTLETDSAPWEERRKPIVLVFEDKLWLIAGLDYDYDDVMDYEHEDVWSSPDGVTWTYEGDIGEDFPGDSSFGVVHKVPKFGPKPSPGVDAIEL
jgi:hypothetical protein